jgi:dihydrofolate reductase
MQISLIVAMAKNRVIGADNRLPWHLSADLKRFRKITLGKPVLMGRKTFESIGRPLPGRKNLVLTRTPHFEAPGCLVVHSIAEAIREAGDAPELMVIGGASLYAECLPSADTLYLTLIDQTFAGDTFFPPIRDEDWLECERQEVTDDPAFASPYRFLVLKRRTDQTQAGDCSSSLGS